MPLRPPSRAGGLVGQALALTARGSVPRMRRLVVVLLAVLVLAVPAPSYAVEQLPVGTDADYQLGGLRDGARSTSGSWCATARLVRPGCTTSATSTASDPAERAAVLAAAPPPAAHPRWSAGRRRGVGGAVVRPAHPREAAGAGRIVGRWTAGCARAGYEAVEYDNLDSFTRSHGLLKRRHAVAYARLLTRRAHRVGLAVAQKNLPGLHGRRIGFDFAIAEECGRYDECGRYAREYGRRVLVVEYRRRDFRATCREYGDRLAVVLRDRDLSPRGTPVVVLN